MEATLAVSHLGFKHCDEPMIGAISSPERSSLTFFALSLSLSLSYGQTLSSLATKLIHNKEEGNCAAE
ncbi:hypothetical protein Ahy_B03g067840 isoform B [Arachis hypogaea]|uniref:Uncharacterized protein n=1 Tax=Arachis hypogaea TaxID=3818 RepID=A0A445A844_ARAHY|nr:hypothetical protein Ahy_B03g067840 isoform B [Arachis hypogaea]